MRRSTRSSSSIATFAYSTFSAGRRILAHLLHEALGGGDRVADLVRDGRGEVRDVGLLLGLHRFLLALAPRARWWDRSSAPSDVREPNTAM
jgi:hypothetical protein